MNKTTHVANEDPQGTCTRRFHIHMLCAEHFSHFAPANAMVIYYSMRFNITFRFRLSCWRGTANSPTSHQPPCTVQRLRSLRLMALFACQPRHNLFIMSGTYVRICPCLLVRRNIAQYASCCCLCAGAAAVLLVAPHSLKDEYLCGSTREHKLRFRAAQ